MLTDTVKNIVYRNGLVVPNVTSILGQTTQACSVRKTFIRGIEKLNKTYDTNVGKRTLIV